MILLRPSFWVKANFSLKFISAEKTLSEEWIQLKA